jgi:hypothetical protein
LGFAIPDKKFSLESESDYYSWLMEFQRLRLTTTGPVTQSYSTDVQGCELLPSVEEIARMGLARLPVISPMGSLLDCRGVYTKFPMDPPDPIDEKTLNRFNAIAAGSR